MEGLAAGSPSFFIGDPVVNETTGIA